MMQAQSLRKKEKPPYHVGQNVGWILRWAWKERKSIIFLCIASAVCGTALNLVKLLIAPGILEKLEKSAPLPELLTVIALFSLLLIVFSALNMYLPINALYPKIDLRVKILNQVNWKTDVTSFPNTEDPNVLKKLEKAQEITSGNSQASEAIWNTLTDLLKNLLGFLLYLLLLSSLEPILAFVSLAAACIAYFAGKRIHEWGFRHRDEESAYLKQMNEVLKKSSLRVLGKDVRIFGMIPWLEEVYLRAQKAYHSFISRRERIYFWADAIDAVLAFLRNGVAYLYLIAMALGGGLSAAEFLLYFSAAGGFAEWVTGILTTFSTLRTQSLDLCSIREYLDLPEPFLFENGTSIPMRQGMPCEIKLDQVSFRYPGAEKDTLHKVNLTIHPGEKLAIVGLNGAGKTTLVKLICGLYDPTEGRVLFNGTDVRTLNRREYYHLFSAVFQQFSVLETTVAENVAQSTRFDVKRIDACLEQAGLLEKIRELPDGLSTHVGKTVFEDGVDFSGGEMQRLMLARALYRNAPIIVLDEPTAALDPIAENELYLKYSDLTAGHTSVYISHRLASTRFCDRILLLADQGIAEEGTHEELMQQNGRYAELYALQSRYYGKEKPVSDEDTFPGRRDLCED